MKQCELEQLDDYKMWSKPSWEIGIGQTKPENLQKNIE